MVTPNQFIPDIVGGISRGLEKRQKLQLAQQEVGIAGKKLQLQQQKQGEDIRQQQLASIFKLAPFNGPAAARAFNELGFGEELGTGDIQFLKREKDESLFLLQQSGQVIGASSRGSRIVSTSVGTLSIRTLRVP